MCKTLVFWMLRKWSLSIKFPDMKKKGLIFKSWWFWVVIAVVVILLIFFFPKSCGGSGGIPPGPYSSINCNCIGFKGSIGYPYITDAVETSCFGICLKSSCKTTISPPINPPDENNIPTNNTIPFVIPPVTNTNISLNKSLKFFIKPANPQYKRGQNVTIQYTLENIDNKTINIPSNVANGFEVKNEGNIVLNYDGNGSGIRIITDSQSIEAGKKISGSIIVLGSDYNFYSIGNIGDGYWNTITAYIGDLKSNRIIVRFV